MVLSESLKVSICLFFYQHRIPAFKLNETLLSRKGATAVGTWYVIFWSLNQKPLASWSSGMASWPIGRRMKAGVAPPPTINSSHPLRECVFVTITLSPVGSEVLFPSV